MNRLRRAGLLAMLALLVADCAGLALHGSGFSTFVDGWLGAVTPWSAALVCVLAWRRAGPRRPDALLAALAVSAFAAGNTYYVVALAGGQSLPFPSPGDIGYLAFYPLVLAAVVLAVRRQASGLGWASLLDSVLGGLGAAALLALILSPALAAPLSGPASIGAAVSLAYPAFDLLLVAAIAGMTAVRGLCGRRCSLLISGLAVFAASDVTYVLRVLHGTYVVGTLLDAGWVLGLALVALWVDANSGLAVPARRGAVSALAALVVPASATAVGLAVLAVGSRRQLALVVVLLAVGTLVAASVRTQLAFRALVRMADLRVQASTDDLTGLPNRRALYAEGARRMERSPELRHALLLLDLDKFKEVNDSLGHPVGDRLLVDVGVRLRNRLRQADLLVRLGGDEFAVLLQDAGEQESGLVAANLRAALEKPFLLDGLTLHSSVSIGIALYPDHGDDLSTLLRKADVAMYKAKAERSGQAVYRRTDDADGDARLRLLQELHEALGRRDQLVLHYQPKVALATGRPCGLEALVRWQHPTRGLLYPDSFLPLVEDAGLMPRLTAHVLAAALDQAAVWRRAGQELPVAVNLSASSLVDASLPDQVADLLAGRGLPPEALQLEITEQFLMGDRDRARTILLRLRLSGVQISVDDFGTGYSSLAYLRELPVDELKLDRSFVTPMTTDPRAAALVASTIGLAHSLGLRMVAEGVEDVTTLRELARLGCDQAQGYFVLRPCDAAGVYAWLADLAPSDGELPDIVVLGESA